MQIIEINWLGPFSIDQIKGFDSDIDYGVYQIYGNHSVMGENQLLYIGKSQQRTFSVRIPEHSDFINYDYHDYKIYIGRLGNDNVCSELTWNDLIDKAERILIDYCQPSFNSQINNLINDLKDDIVLLNHNKRYKIPFTISTIWKQSSNSKGTWKPYSNKMY